MFCIGGWASHRDFSDILHRSGLVEISAISHVTDGEKRMHFQITPLKVMFPFLKSKDALAPITNEGCNIKGVDIRV